MRKLIVTFFYVGFVPGAPGTAASLLATLLAAAYYVFFFSFFNLWPLLAAAGILFFAGVALGPWAIAHFQSPDPRQFVLDEVVGQLLACSALPFLPLVADRTPGGTAGALAIAFVLFRLLDIAKPPPIRQTERLPAGWGIMADDLLAGLLAGLILIGLAALYPAISHAQ